MTERDSQVLDEMRPVIRPWLDDAIATLPQGDQLPDRVRDLVMAEIAAPPGNRGARLLRPLQSMFSATKFVVAGVIVALFGGFVLVAQPLGPQGGVPGAPTGEAGTFTPAGSLAEARAEHTATLLDDGRVLVVGGWGGDEASLTSAELWDPVTTSFESVSPLAVPRSAHTATLMPDGHVLVVGGWGGDEASETSARLWDPVTGSFEPTGSLAEGVAGHTATLLDDGRVLVIGGGGQGHPIASAALWDPETGTFEPTGSLAEGVEDHTATLLDDGRVLVVGEATAEVWDPVTASFEPTGSLAEPRWAHSATLLSDGRVLVVAGQLLGPPGPFGVVASAEVWDPATESFEPAGALADARQGHVATLLSDGRVLIVGGGRGYNMVGPATAEVWDPATESFGPAGGSLAKARGGHTATLLPDGRVLIVGGDAPGGHLATAEVWEPSDG